MTRVLARRLLSLVFAAAAVGSLAAVADAATLAPSAGERTAIIRAFGDPAVAAPCLVVRVAASDRRYGDVRPRTSGRCARWAFNGTNVLERVAGHRWKVLFEGSSYSCPVAHIPRAVQRDLGVCP